MGLVIPALFLIFAATFGGLSLKFAGLVHLRHIGLAFLMCGFGIFVQAAWWPSHFQANAIIATASYLVGAQCLAEALSRRSARSLGPVFHVAAFFVPMLATVVCLFAIPSVIARVYILNFSFGSILLFAAWRNRQLLNGSGADKILLWTIVLVGAHFFPRTLLTASTFQSSTDGGYGGSTFWLVLQYSITLLAAAGAVSMLVVTGADIVASLKRERDTDALTGLLNRRGLELQVDELSKTPVGGRSVILADLDNFKAINDTWGHSVGDEVLKEISERIDQVTRKGDIVARIGGEEFVFVITASLAEAALFAERVRSAIESRPIETLEGSLEMTTSLGVSAYGAHDSFWDVVKNADAALYSAKRAGRNTTRVHGSVALEAAGPTGVI
ncbi:GGDEF domain-containing protein [Devosia faecipullorum]|uniref:GGDEF domain-containing protein n=1 Tax=Devosia faecipullorum TaxID=2755039 RepID=UPI00187B696C|nr:GGDEF domain-containing protein [Devosia faecipullorum]MBE7731466.1 GGDEF domain-containing protein [Devosia faecipullorum]